MKVIGAGFPRTGTMSMQAALNQLGFPCYHMETVLHDPSHLKVWDEFYSGQKPMDWAFVFDEYEATVDAPACFFYKEAMAKYRTASSFELGAICGLCWRRNWWEKRRAAFVLVRLINPSHCALHRPAAWVVGWHVVTRIPAP